MSINIHTFIENIGGIDKLPEHGVDIHSPACPVPIGLDEDGNPVAIELTPRRWAHMIVAGNTGSGKTNFLQVLQESAETIYPGLIEFLPISYVSDIKKAESISLRRQEVLSNLGVRDVEEYNQKYPEHPMSEIFLLIDGYPEKKFPDPHWDELNSLARVGRSVGIQQILTAQAPGKDLELLSTRVCFRTTDTVSNRILGSDAATKLKSRHAIIQTPNTEHEVEVFESTKYSLHKSPDNRDPLDPKNFLELEDLVEQIMRIPGDLNISGVEVVEKMEEALKVIYSPENLTQFNLYSSNRYYLVNKRERAELWGITTSNYNKLVEILAWFDDRAREDHDDTEDIPDLLHSFSMDKRFGYSTEFAMLQAILDRVKTYCKKPSILLLVEIKVLYKKFVKFVA